MTLPASYEDVFQRLNKMNKSSFFIALAALISLNFSAGALAEEYISGTKVSYSQLRDPMTDANLSIIFMDELHDTGSYTYLSMKCAAGEGWIFGISTKHQLLDSSTEDFDLNDITFDQNYLVTYRVGNGQPATIYDLTPAYLGGKLRPETVLFYDTNANNAIAQGLVDGQKVTIRIQPRGSSTIRGTLDYTFMPAGFAKAFAAVNYCF